MADKKLDIFSLLNDLNSEKTGIYNRLSEEEKKGFAPLVVMRWLSCTSDERQIILLNEFVNPYVFSLGKHPELLMNLLHTASSKTNKRYYWLNVKNKSKNTESIKVIQQYFDMSAREAKQLYPFPTDEDILLMAEELGYQKEEMIKLKKELCK